MQFKLLETALLDNVEIKLRPKNLQIHWFDVLKT